MSDFDFDVVTGPSRASCPALPSEPETEEDGNPADKSGPA